MGHGTSQTRCRPSSRSRSRRYRIWRARSVRSLQTVPMNTVVALVLAAIGSNTASQVSGTMSCASLATSSRSAVRPRAFAPGAAEAKVTLAFSNRTVVSLVWVWSHVSGLASRRSRRRSRVIMACGCNVGAATTTAPPSWDWRRSRKARSWASISSFPAWRLKTIANWSPRRASMLSRMAWAGATW